jgi:pimeloyl-ACP methyl ester carboxylesterase
LSDREVAGEITLDALVSDMECVVDAAGLDRFSLMGSSQGGAVSLAYTARHPERVTQLVLLDASFAARSCASKRHKNRSTRCARLWLKAGRKTNPHSARCSRRSSSLAELASRWTPSTSCSASAHQQSTRCGWCGRFSMLDARASLGLCVARLS